MATPEVRGLGHSVKRKEDERFIRGKGNYVDDITLPGMLHLELLRSPYAHVQGLVDAALARVRSPAGLDLGPSTQEEIAVAILAELVAWRHAGKAAESTQEAVDPVCGMAVSVAGATETAEVGGVLYYFCGAGCRRRFESDPASYLTEVNQT